MHLLPLKATESLITNNVSLALGELSQKVAKFDPPPVNTTTSASHINCLFH